MKIDVPTNKPQPVWLRRCLIVTAIMISCLTSFRVQATKIEMRGTEYVDISVQQLISVYKNAFQQAGLEVATLWEKADGGVTLRMRFLPAGYPKKYKEAVHTVSIIGSEDLSWKCDPCKVLKSFEATQSFSGVSAIDIGYQIRHTLENAYDQIDKSLRSNLKNDQVDSRVVENNQISVKEFISAYKQAYEELGFKLFRMEALSRTDYGDSEARFLTFSYKKRDPFGGIGLSSLKMSVSNSYSCPCYLVSESQIDKIRDSLSEKLTKEALNAGLMDDGKALSSFYNDLEKIDTKARALAAEKLTNYRR